MDMVRKGVSAVEELLGAAFRLPWWGGILLAFAGYIFLHPFAIMVVAEPSDMEHLVAFRSIQFCKGIAATAQYVVPLMFLGISIISAFAHRKGKK